MRRSSFMLLVATAVGSCSPTGNDGTTPTIAVATVTVAPLLDTVYIGAVSQLAATTKDVDGNVLTGRTVTWSKVGAGASVSSNGLVTGVSSGDVTVTATSEGIHGDASIIVRPVPVASVIVTPPTDTIYLGATATFTATPRDSIGGTLTGRIATWSSLDAAASVNNVGVVTSLSLGTARIVAYVEGKGDTTIVTVLPVPVASVILTPAADTLYPTNTTQLVAATRDSANGVLNGRTIIWSSLDAAASVNNAGLVTALSVGTARIVAASEGKADTALITVRQVPVASVVIAPDSARLFITATAQLSATTKDSAGGTLNGRIIGWSSLDAAASVSGTGLVTGVSQGTARIVASSEGKADTVPVTVVTVPVASVVITPGTPALHTRETLQLTATTRDSAANVLAGRVVTWLSFNTTIVTVSGTGLVTPHDTGDVSVSATSEGKADTVLVHVTVPPVGSVVITPAVDTIVLGDSVQLSAAVLDTAGVALTGRPVSWSSLDTTAFVSSSNFVVASYLGIARIVATREGHADTATVVVVAVAPTLPPLTGTWVGHGVSSLNGPFDIIVVFTQTDSTLGGAWEGGQRDAGSITGTVQGTATLIHANGTNGGTCSSDWTATRVGADSLNGTFQFSGGGCPIPTNNGPLSAHRVAATASVLITSSVAALTVGDSAQFAAVARDSGNVTLNDRTPRWRSTDTSVATVTSAGMVHALAAGSAGIIAEGQGKADTALVTVTGGWSGGPSLSGTWIGVADDTSSALAMTFVQVDSTLSGGHVDLDNTNPGSLDGVVHGGTATIVLHHLKFPAGLYCDATWTATRFGPDTLSGADVVTGAGCSGSGTIVAVRRNAGPSLVGPFDVSVTAGQDAVGGVATDGNNTLVIYQRRVADTTQPAMLFARLVDSTGATIAGESQFSPQGDPPEAAFGGGTYLTAWWSPGDVILAQLIGSGGALVGGNFTVVPSSGPPYSLGSACGLSYAKTTFFVTYSRQTGSYNTQGDPLFRVYGRPISTAGAVGGEVTVSDGFGKCDGQAVLSSDGARFLAVWKTMDSVVVGPGQTLKARTIDEGGALGPVEVIASPANEDGVQSVAPRADGGWVTGWNEVLDTLGNAVAYAQMLDANGAPSGGAIPIGSGGAPTLGGVGRWVGGWSAIWIERTTPASGSSANIQYYSNDGTPVGTTRVMATPDFAGKVAYPLANTEGVGRSFIALQFMSPGSSILDFDRFSSDIRAVWVRP